MLALVVILSGCAGSGARDPGFGEGLDIDMREPRAGSGEVVAEFSGGSVSMDDLLPIMLERAGGEALEFVLLDALLEREIGARGLTVGAREIDAERRLFVERQSSFSGAQTDAQIDAVFRAMVRERALSDESVDALMRRNAMLRALVRERVTVSEQEIVQAHAIIHGRVAHISMILAGSAEEAGVIRARVLDAAGDRAAVFAREARASSVDPSATLGGALEPVSLEDPVVPLVIRDAVRSMTPGDVSEVLLLSGEGRALGALVMLHELLPGSGRPIGEVRDEIRRELFYTKQWLAMQDLSVSLIRGSGLVIREDAMFRAWQRHTGSTD